MYTSPYTHTCPLLHKTPYTHTSVTTNPCPFPPPPSDLGCHIDGFIATAASTAVIGASEATPVTGRAADVLAAAETAFEAAIRLMRPGKHIADVADVLNTAVESYEYVRECV